MLTMLRHHFGCVCECKEHCCSEQECTAEECKCKELERPVEFEFLMDIETPTIH